MSLSQRKAIWVQLKIDFPGLIERVAYDANLGTWCIAGDFVLLEIICVHDNVQIFFVVRIDHKGVQTTTNLPQQYGLCATQTLAGYNSFRIQVHDAHVVKMVGLKKVHENLHKAPNEPFSFSIMSRRGADTIPLAWCRRPGKVSEWPLTASPDCCPTEKNRRQGKGK